MATFHFTAIDKNDSFIRDKREGKSLRRVTAQLESEGFTIVNINEEKLSQLSRFNHLFDTVSRLDKIFFTRHLYTMLESGIALDQAVKISVEQTTHQKFRFVLMDIHRRLQQGQSFHQSLTAHNKYFSNFYISMVRVGENSGKLDEVLAYLLEQQESDYDLVTKSRGAMVYPAVIISALFVMVIFMMIFVIPKITEVLTEYDVTLPLATRALIGLSQFLINYGIILIPVFIMLGYAFRTWKNSKRGKWQWDSFLLSLPGINQMIVEFNIARFTRSLSSLLKSGLQIDHAVDLSADVSNNSHYQKTLKSAIGFIRKGIALSEVLKGHPKLYPKITTRMIEVGERTGKLDHMLSRLAIFYEKSIAATVGNISSIIEPALLISIGLAVAFVAIAVLTPIWSYSESI